MVMPGGSERECTQIEAAMCLGDMSINKAEVAALAAECLPSSECWSARKSSRFYAIHWVAAPRFSMV